MFLLGPASVIAGDENINFLLTANLNGRFDVSIENQDQNDFMLLMAQSLLNEKKNHPADLYLDLGNAFYPGLLSRFSYGSAVMDFLNDFDCAATLVSSQDLNIGINNLEFLGKDKSTQLLSANIEKYGSAVFSPYIVRYLKGKKFAFIGISSEKGFFDIAEKKLLGVSLTDYDVVLSRILELLQNEAIDYIVLLSGRSYADNLAVMEKFKQISLCISGGDATGELYSVKAERVDIGGGRSLVTLTNPDGFYTLSLYARQTLSVNVLKFAPAARAATRDKAYGEFADRLAIWKERFAREGEAEVVKDACCDVYADDMRIAQLLRHRFRAEVAMLEKNSISPGNISGRITYLDILKMVNNQFPVFSFKISGSELKQAADLEKNLVIAGTDGKFVQGYPIEDKRLYLICAPQSVYDRLAKIFNRNIPYTNSWKSISDEIKEDFEGDRAIANSDYGYLDDRFRTLVDLSLSNFYDRSDVSRGNDIDIPPGKPADSYQKWGLEDKIDVSLYNQYHKFTFTPYIFYMRQDQNYFQNLLRGTFLYMYNLNPFLKPYHKSQMDTVVEVVNDFRPVLFRETFGAVFETTYITGKVGLGFEKQTQDPQKPLFSGIETIVDAKYDFLEYMTYSFDLDTFYSVERIDFGERQIRAEISNAVSFKLNSYMSFSTKYKWFYFYSGESEEQYRDSQVLLSLELITDFKFF